MKPPVLIITGYGVNCEAESAAAWEKAGAAPRLIHLHDLLENPSALHEHRALMFIGGFSFGDHMGSGHVLALRIRQRIRDHLRKFIEAGHLVLGVCNGFQVMVKLGLLPGLDGDYFTQKAALMQNDCGTFQNFWVRLAFDPGSPCVFTRGLAPMDLPIRHGEGKIYIRDAAVLARVEAEHLAPCRYVDPADSAPAMRFPHNPNGSMNAIAGLCDPTGRVFGLMPHPEAFIFPENHPLWPRSALSGSLPEEGAGMAFFRNAVEIIENGS